MDYQKYIQENRQFAAELLKTEEEFLSYYAWPQGFGSTAGPFGGIGGQSCSTFTIEAYTDGRDAVLFCSGKRWKVVRGFDPREAVSKGV